MGRGFQGAVLKLFGAKDHRAKVVGRSQLNPNLIRIDFHSETLLYPDGEKPSAWVRLWFPDPDGGSTLHQRAYTFLETDPAAGTFSLGFVTHEPAGPASRWAHESEPGDELIIQRMGGDGFELADPEPDGYLFLGDAASWPAITSIVAIVPAHLPIHVYMEQHQDTDVDLPFPEHPRLEVTWVPAQSNSRALADCLSGRDYTGWHTWVAAESTVTRFAKSVLTKDHNQNKATLHSQAYWIAGRSMGKKADSVDQALQGRPEAAAAVGAGPEASVGAGPGPAANEAAAHGAAAAVAGTTEVKIPAADPATASPASAPAAVPTAPPSVLAPARTAFILSGLAQACLSILQIVPLILFAELARRFTVGAPRNELFSLALTGLVVMAVVAVASSAFLIAIHAYDQGFSADLRKQVVRKFAGVPLGWFSGRRPADSVRLVKDDVSALHYLVTHAIPDLVGAIVTPLAMLIYLFTVDWRLSLVLLVPVALYVTTMLRMSLGDRAKLTRMLQWNASLQADSGKFVEGQRVSRLFGNDASANLPRELRSVGDFVAEWQQETIGKKTMALQLNRPLTTLVVIVLFGTLFVVAGWIEAAAILPFLILGNSFGNRLLAISYAAAGLTASLDAKASLELFLAERELSHGPQSAPAASSSQAAASAQAQSLGSALDATPTPAIELRQVTFGYVPTRTVLQDFTLSVAAGTTVALVGPSGAGTSTVAALAARLWDPRAGEVLLHGVDYRSIDEDQLRRRIATVLQDVQLVGGSVHDNIALGHPDATRAQVVEAAKAAYIHEVIEALPNGYDTALGRNSLSGGQRQRIAIARAHLSRPEIVILDEATAAADPDSEWEIRQGLRRLTAGKTVIVVAHRLHTIADADRIVVIDGGRIAQSGTFTELLEQPGLFQQLHASARKAVAL